MSAWSPDLYTAAWLYAAAAHQGQTMPGSDLPYIMHVANVAMEVTFAIAARGGIDEADLAVQCALLHDVVEDTDRTIDDVRAQFGDAVAAGVAALTKDEALESKSAMMQDSLDRIRQQPHAVWIVKLADRITNLQKPPHYWTSTKISSYELEAQAIALALGEACPILGPRLLQKIDEYPPQ